MFSVNNYHFLVRFFHDKKKQPEKWWILTEWITAMPRKISVIWLPGYDKRQITWSRDDGKIPMVFHISASNSMALKFLPFLVVIHHHCFGGVVPCQQSSAPRGRSGLHPFILGRVPWAHGMAMSFRGNITWIWWWVPMILGEKNEYDVFFWIKWQF